jgi:TolB-like protein/pimeloyl-ACP methyl ester carboxylesterase/Tfp pilus assembly protein PilF
LEIDRNPQFNGWLTAQRRRFRACHAAILEHLVRSLPTESEAVFDVLEKWLELAPFDRAAHEIVLNALAQRGRIREGEEHLAATARLAEGLNWTPIRDAWRAARGGQASASPSAGADSASGQSPPIGLAEQRIRFCTSRDGVRIAFAAAGQGPPLVRVNNWFTHLEIDWDSPVWRHWLEAFVERRMLVRYDPRGSGLSDRGANDYSLNAWVADLEAVVDALGLRRFPLVRLCQGGLVAIAYAVRHPDRVSRLVLYSSYPHGAYVDGVAGKLTKQAQTLSQMIEMGWGREAGAFREFFANLLMPDGGREQLKWIGELQRRSASPETACRLWNAFHAFDIREEAPKITIPTLVFHVRGDAMVPFECGRQLAAMIPNARFMPLESKNHILLPHEKAWETFRKELNDFLNADEQISTAPGSELSDLTQREKELLASRRPPAVGLSEIAGTSAAPTAVLARPAVAILPFANLSGDVEQEYFADGISEDLITALSHWRWFPVIARNSTLAYKGRATDVTQIGRELNARYVLEGSVRRANDSVRIAAQLIDAGNGHYLWAQTYDRRLSDVFELQDEITRTIVAAIEPQLSRAEQQRALRKRPESLDAWDLSLRALFHLRRAAKQDLAEAEQLLTEAARMDPMASYAQSLIALCRFTSALGGWTRNPARALASTHAAAKEAVALDETDWLAHALLGIAVLWTQRDHDRAIEEQEKALTLNPSGSPSHQFAGCVRSFVGQPAAAIPHLEAVLQLDPRYQTLASVLSDLGLAYFLLEEADEALAWFDRAIAEQPDYVRAWQRRAACLGHMGRTEGASATLGHVLELQPDFSLAYVQATYPFRDPAHAKMLSEGLRRAGWRE